MLGVEYLKTRQFELALVSLEKAVTLVPRDPVDRSNLGLALTATGQYVLAEFEVRKVLVLNLDNPKTRELLSEVLALAGKHQQVP